MNGYVGKIWAQYTSLIDRARSTKTDIPHSSIRALLILAVVMVVIAVAGYVLGGYQVAFMTINRFGANIPATVLESVTVFGDGIFLLVLVLLFACRNIRFHWTVLFASLLSAVVINLSKDYFAMPRPPAVLDAETFTLIGRAYQSRSFPSGHSATAFLLASICFCYTKNISLKVVFIGLAVLAALSRVLVGVHWPMDTLVGGAMGIVLGVSAVVITAKWQFGVSAAVHLFTLALMVMACVVIFVEGNDYTLAMPLLYAASGAALVQVVKSYLWVK